MEPPHDETEHPDRVLFTAWTDRGDQKAAKRLYRYYFRVVWRFLINKVSDPHERDDLVNEIFGRFFANLSRFMAPTTPTTAALGAIPWLVGIARNVFLEHLRRVYRREGLELALRSASELMPNSLSSIVTARHELAALGQALRNLPLPDQILVEAKYFEYLTYDQLAALLEIPASTVPGRLRGATNRLRTGLRAHLTVRGQDLQAEDAEAAIEGWLADLRREMSAFHRGRPA